MDKNDIYRPYRIIIECFTPFLSILKIFEFFQNLSIPVQKFFLPFFENSKKVIFGAYGKQGKRSNFINM